MKLKILSLLFLMLPLFAFSAKYWVGPTGTITLTMWNNPANWSGNNIAGAQTGVPTPGEKVIFTSAVTFDATLASKITVGNNIDILSGGSVTIPSGSTFQTGTIRVGGGSLINNGTLTDNTSLTNQINVLYIAPGGGTITNNGTMSIRNLGDAGTVSGTFTNNGTVNVLKDIVLKSLTLNNNGTATSEGLDIRTGGIFNNYGTYTSAGAYQSTKITVLSGGKMNNFCGGTINSIITGNPTTGSGGDIYAVDIAGNFTNEGTLNIGNPYPQAPNPGSKGMIVRSSGNFLSQGPCVVYHFNIDATNCPIQNNTGANGSFSLAPATGQVYSGANSASCNASLVLPAKLVSFTGTNYNGKTMLYWETSLEINVNRFEVEQSLDGTNFQNIANVAANGAPGKYSQAANQSAAVAYYRLKTIDTDGKFEYSNIVRISLNNSTKSFSYSVNPTAVAQNGSYTITVNSKVYRGVATVSTFNAVGALVKTEKISINSDITIVPARTGNLAKGAYYVRISAGDNRAEAKSLIIQ